MPYNSKPSVLREIVERMDIEEVDAEVVGREISTEKAEWIARSQAQVFSVLSLLTRADTNHLVRSCDDKNGIRGMVEI